MWYILVTGLILLGIFCGTNLMLLDSYYNNSEWAPKKHRFVNGILNPGDSIVALFSRNQLNQKLKHLSEAPPPKELSYGAMCYSIMLPPPMDSVEYVCPVCGEKTVYKKTNFSDNWYYISNLLKDEIVEYRREVAKIEGVFIKLDESEFCKHCSPNIKNPELYLETNILGESDTNKVKGITLFDLQLIHNFLDDKIVYKDSYDSEVPLSLHANRIKKILNLK